MQYISESLSPDEKLIHVGRFHWFYTASACMWIGIGIIGMIAIIWASVYFEVKSSIPGKFIDTKFYDQAWAANVKDKGGYFKIALSLTLGLKLAAFAVFVFGLFSFSRMMITKASTEIAVTSKRLIYKVGLVARSVGEIDIYRIEGVNVQQGIFGRIFGYGRLMVRGTGVGEVYLPPIANPITFRKAIDFARSKDKRHLPE